MVYHLVQDIVAERHMHYLSNLLVSLLLVSLLLVSLLLVSLLLVSLLQKLLRKASTLFRSCANKIFAHYLNL